MPRPTPPSVNEISRLVRDLTHKEQDPPTSSALIKNEARKIQKEWAALGEMSHIDPLPAPLRPVINGSGILLHTNLGRAPLGTRLLERLSKTAFGYSDLELDLETGERGSRTRYLDELFTSFVPYYKPVWVNNGAAAVLLSLRTIKEEFGLKRALISRGELVEIGGGFRVPEIMAESGLDLVEIGTTNKTRLADYKEELKKEPALVVKVAPSNFVMQGFVESVEPRELAPLCEKYDVPLFFDAGTLSPEQLRVVPRGFTALAMSTDKSLGSCQGGLILATPKFQKKLLKNPFYRALRLDKVALASLEFAFEAFAEKKERSRLPLFEMIHTPLETLKDRARELASSEFRNFRLIVKPTTASLGGGTISENFASVGLTIDTPENSRFSATKILYFLRLGRPSVLATVFEGRATIDLKTVLSSDLPSLATALQGLDRKIQAGSS